MNVLDALPYDMKQHEISRFLDPMSRIEFNALLGSDERVYKKLPADYAVTHHLRMVYDEYQKTARMVKNSMLLIEHSREFRSTRVMRFTLHLRRLLTFFNNPMNQLAIMYQKNLKEMLLKTWAEWQEEDADVYDFISEAQKEEIQKNSRTSLRIIEAIPFVRHINVQKIQSVY
jgi:hypothetical protein